MDKENILQYPAVFLVLPIYLAKELTYIFLHFELFSYKLTIFPPLHFNLFPAFLLSSLLQRANKLLPVQVFWAAQLESVNHLSQLLYQLTWLWQWVAGKAQCWDRKGERKPKPATPNAWWKKAGW